MTRYLFIPAQSATPRRNAAGLPSAGSSFFRKDIACQFKNYSHGLMGFNLTEVIVLPINSILVPINRVINWAIIEPRQTRLFVNLLV